MDEYEVEAISESRCLLRTGMALLQKMVQEGPDSSAFYSIKSRKDQAVRSRYGICAVFTQLQ